MRRTEYLINELRKSTDNTNANGVKDAEIVSYLNYGQKLLQNIIFKTNPKSDIFIKNAEYSYNAEGTYDLPADIFAENAIAAVEYKQGDRYYKIDRIDRIELSSGYYVENKKLKIEGYKFFDIRVTVFRELPKMDKRWGRIGTVSSGVSLTLTGIDTDASTVDDHVTVVDKFGAQVLPGIYVDNYNGSIWETTNLLAGVTIDQFVCMGKNTVNASELPDACETYLLDYVRQRIYTRNNYDDAGKQVYFTDSQRADIADLFKNNQKDVMFPPITDYDAMDFDV